MLALIPKESKGRRRKAAIAFYTSMAMLFALFIIIFLHSGATWEKLLQLLLPLICLLVFGSRVMVASNRMHGEAPKLVQEAVALRYYWGGRYSQYRYLDYLIKEDGRFKRRSRTNLIMQAVPATGDIIVIGKNKWITFVLAESGERPGRMWRIF